MAGVSRTTRLLPIAALTLLIGPGCVGGTAAGGGGVYVPVQDGFSGGATTSDSGSAGTDAGGEADAAGGSGVDGEPGPVVDIDSGGGWSDGSSSSGASPDAASSGGSGGGGDGGASTSGGGAAEVSPADSGGSCGDGQCVFPENTASCPADCGGGLGQCGDAICEGLETASSCPIDCLPEAKSLWSCAQNKCAARAAQCTASSGCVQALNKGLMCMKTCGKLDTSCASQCMSAFGSNSAALALATCAVSGGCLGGGATGPTCGDGTCEGGESASSCPADCKTTPANACGDAQCSAGESKATCPIDCEPEAAKQWACLKSGCPAEAAKCQADPACLQAVNDTVVCFKSCLAAGGTADSCFGQCAGMAAKNANAISTLTCGLQKCPLAAP